MNATWKLLKGSATITAGTIQSSSTSGSIELDIPENTGTKEITYTFVIEDSEDSTCTGSTKIISKPCGGGGECTCDSVSLDMSDVYFTWDEYSAEDKQLVNVQDDGSCITNISVAGGGTNFHAEADTTDNSIIVYPNSENESTTDTRTATVTVTVKINNDGSTKTCTKYITLTQGSKGGSSDCTNLSSLISPGDVTLVATNPLQHALVYRVNPNKCQAYVISHGSNWDTYGFKNGWCMNAGNWDSNTCVHGDVSGGREYLWLWGTKDNTGTEPRSSTLSFGIQGVPGTAFTITLTQEAGGGGGDCGCSVLKESIPSELNLTAEATSFTYTLFDSTVSSECKAKFGAIVDGTATWLSAAYNSSTGKLTINVDALPSDTESRNGYVGIRYEGVSPSDLCHTIDITQDNSDCGCNKLNNIYTETNPLIIAGKGEDYAQVIDINPNGCNAQWIPNATPEGYDWPSSMRLSWSDSNTNLYPTCTHVGCIGKRYLWVWSTEDVTTTEHYALRIQISDTMTHCFYLYVDQTAESCGCSNFRNVGSSESNPISNNGYTNLQPIAQFTTEDCDASTLTVTADADWLTNLSVQRISTGSNDYFVLAKVKFNGSSSRNSTVTVKRNDNTTCGSIKVYQAGCEGSVDKYKTQLANLSISENGATIGSSYYKPNDTFTYRGNTYNCSTIFLSPKGGEYKFTMSGICENIRAYLVNVGGDPTVGPTFKKVDKSDGKYEYTISAQTNTSLEYTSYVMSFGTTSLPNSYGLLRLYEDTDENLDGGSNRCIVSDYNTRLTIPNIMRIPSGGGATVAEINPARTNRCLANDLAESCDGVYYKSDGVPEWLTVRWSTHERLPHKHLEVSASNYSGTRFYDLPIGAPGGIVKSITVVQGVYAKFNVSSTTIGRTVGSTVRVPITATPEIDGGNFKVYKSDGTTITQDLYVDYLSSSEIVLQVISGGVAANTKYYIKILVNGVITSTLEVTTQN